jgi:hypothetical protein
MGISNTFYTVGFYNKLNLHFSYDLFLFGRFLDLSFFKRFTFYTGHL